MIVKCSKELQPTREGPPLGGILWIHSQSWFWNGRHRGEIDKFPNMVNQIFNHWLASVRTTEASFCDNLRRSDHFAENPAGESLPTEVTAPELQAYFIWRNTCFGIWLTPRVVRKELLQQWCGHNPESQSLGLMPRCGAQKNARREKPLRSFFFAQESVN